VQAVADIVFWCWHITILTCPLLTGIEGAMGALADAVGVGVMDEAALEGRFDDLAEGVMRYVG
jgi:hypothetical protein